MQRVQLGVADRNCRFLQDAVVAPDAEEIVGAGLNPEINRVSARRRGAERHDALSRLAKLAREAGTDAGQPEQRPALRIDNAALAAQIDQQHDLLAGSGRRHRAGEVKPGAVERRLAPALSRAQRELAALPALGERHRLGRHPGGGAQLSDGRVDGRLVRLLDVAERAGCRDRRVGHSTLFPGAAPIAQPRCNGSRHKVNEIESGRGYPLPMVDTAAFAGWRNQYRQPAPAPRPCRAIGRASGARRDSAGFRHAALHCRAAARARLCDSRLLWQDLCRAAHRRVHRPADTVDAFPRGDPQSRVTFRAAGRPARGPRSEHCALASLDHRHKVSAVPAPENAADRR